PLLSPAAGCGVNELREAGELARVAPTLGKVACEIDGGESVRHGDPSDAGARWDVRAKAMVALGARRTCDQLMDGVTGRPRRTGDRPELFPLDEVDLDVRSTGCGGRPSPRGDRSHRVRLRAA